MNAVLRLLPASSLALALLAGASAQAGDLNTAIGGGAGGAAGAMIGQQIGGANGAVLGGAVGGAVGGGVSTSGSGRSGAMVGGALGGATGAAVGQRVGGSTGAIVGAGAGGAVGAELGKNVTQRSGGAYVAQPAVGVQVMDNGYGGPKHKKGHPPGRARGWHKNHGSQPPLRNDPLAARRKGVCLSARAKKKARRKGGLEMRPVRYA